VKDGLAVVCGAGGFVGGFLVKDLLRRGYRVRAVDLKPSERWYQRFDEAEDLPCVDLKKLEACHAALKDARWVYNLAADMGGMGFIENNKTLCMLNVLINTHLLQAARASNVQRFFFSSSACVYNHDKQTDPETPGLKEEDAYPGMPEDGYGWEKLFSERMCRHFSEDFGLTTRVARYHNVYGPMGTYDGGREKVPAAICRKVAQAKLNRTREIEIWGSGEQTRSFTYIDDCIRGTDDIMHSQTITFPINLGSAQKVSINRLVDIVEGIAGTRLKRTYNLNAARGVNGRSSDNTLIRRMLGWEPSIPLEEGLERTYAWIYDQLKSGRSKDSVVNLG